MKPRRMQHDAAVAAVDAPRSRLMMLPHANLSADLIRLSAGRAAKIVFVHGNFNVCTPGTCAC